MLSTFALSRSPHPHRPQLGPALLILCLPPPFGKIFSSNRYGIFVNFSSTCPNRGVGCGGRKKVMSAVRQGRGPKFSGTPPNFSSNQFVVTAVSIVRTGPGALCGCFRGLSTNAFKAPAKCPCCHGARVGVTGIAARHGPLPRRKAPSGPRPCRTADMTLFLPPHPTPRFGHVLLKLTKIP